MNFRAKTITISKMDEFLLLTNKRGVTVDNKNNKNNKSKSSKPREYEGVIYEPSNYSKQQASGGSNGITRKPQRPQTSSAQAARKSQRTKPKKTNFAMFYIVTLIVAVTVCVAIFAVVFNAVTGKDSPNSQDPQGALSPLVSPVPSDDANGNVATDELREFLGFVQSVSDTKGSARVQQIETGEIFELATDVKTALTNKYGQTILLSEFRIGEMVEAQFNPKTNVLKSLSGSNKTWEYKQIKDVKVDIVNQTLSIGNEKYKFGRGFMVTYKGQAYDVSGIKPIDVCSLRGYQDTVWSIEVNKSHGTLQVLGKDSIVEGVLELDTDVFTMLEDFENLDVLEGDHRVVIKGNNVEPLIQDITVKAGEVTTVDIGGVQMRSGELKLTVNESFYTLSINGKITQTGTPIVLEYGEYDVKIEKDDFNPWEGKVVVENSLVDLKVTLEPIVKQTTLIVNTDPSGAEIYLDNNFVGTSPVEIPVSQGSHNVVPRKAGYIPITVNFEINGEPYHTVPIELQRQDPSNAEAPPDLTPESTITP